MLAMWVFMLVMNLGFPAALIGCGRMMEKDPSRATDSSFGYRTKRSIKNQETWDFANQYCGRLWVRMGMALLIFAIPTQALTLLCPSMDSMCLWSFVLTIAETVVFVASYFPVERALKRNFDEDGNRL